MSENKQSKPDKTTHRIRGFVLYVARLLVAFLLGFVPMWLKSREHSAVLLRQSAKQAWPGWRTALPPQPFTRNGAIMKQPVKLPVTSLLLCGQKQRMALIQASRRQK